MRQRALHIELTEGRHDLVQVESPHYVGPVEYAWNCRDENDPTILGAGPLAGSFVPGASSLVIAGRSYLWNGFYPTLLEGGGMILAGLDCNLIAIRGRALKPSVLYIYGRKGNISARVEPLDPEPIWKGTDHGDGLLALLYHLASRHVDEIAHLHVLAVGPAAEKTRFGTIGAVHAEHGKISPYPNFIRRGGFGSRLYHVHWLCGIVIGCDLSTHDILARTNENAANLLEPFQSEMSVEELEQITDFTFNPKLRTKGEMWSTFDAQRQNTLWFNSSSIELSSEERDHLYHRVLEPNFFSPPTFSDPASLGFSACACPCPLEPFKHQGDKIKEFEVYAALGPQLGIAEKISSERMVLHAESLGYDARALGSIIGWVMERLHRGLLDPTEFGLHHLPRWTATDFDPMEDSKSNCELAREIGNGILFADWRKVLADGLRNGCRVSGGASAALGVYIANGENGEFAPHPHWSPGFYAPMPITGEFHQYYGHEFMPPRVLGRKCAQRMVAEIMLQNFGLCRGHRGWSEDLSPDLVNKMCGTSTDWLAHHRNLARSITHRRRVRFWETERVIDIVFSYLRNYHFESAPDAELNRWVRRFREDKPSAARAFWSEINSGLEEFFGS